MPKAKAPLHPDFLKLKVQQPDGIYQLENYQLCESVGYLMKRCLSLLTAAIETDLAPYDLTHPQFAILMMIKERKCETAADIARETGADTGAVTRMLDRLEAKDILRRVRNKEDRRIINIELTATGAQVIAKMPVVAINVLNRHLQHFDKKEIETLQQLLRKLIAHSETATATPSLDADKTKGTTRRKSS